MSPETREAIGTVVAYLIDLLDAEDAPAEDMEDDTEDACRWEDIAGRDRLPGPGDPDDAEDDDPGERDYRAGGKVAA